MEISIDSNVAAQSRIFSSPNQSTTGWQPGIVLPGGPVIDRQDLLIVNDESDGADSVAHSETYLAVGLPITAGIPRNSP